MSAGTLAVAGGASAVAWVSTALAVTLGFVVGASVTVADATEGAFVASVAPPRRAMATPTRTRTATAAMTIGTAFRDPLAATLGEVELIVPTEREEVEPRSAREPLDRKGRVLESGSRMASGEGRV